MITKTGEHRPVEKFNHLMNAADHLFQAIRELEAAQACTAWPHEVESMASFQEELNDFMSHDTEAQMAFASYVIVECKLIISEKRSPADELKRKIAAYKSQTK